MEVFIASSSSTSSSSSPFISACCGAPILRDRKLRVSRSMLWLTQLSIVLLYFAAGLAAADSDAPAVAEFFHMVEDYVEHVPPHMTICMFGLVPFHELLAHQIFARLQPPKYEHTYVHFLNVAGLSSSSSREDEEYQSPGQHSDRDSVGGLADAEKDADPSGDEETPPTNQLQILRLLQDTYGKNRVNGFRDARTSFDSYCSMIILSLHYPHVSFEDVSIVARKIDSIFLGYIKSESSCLTSQLECRWMSRSWEAVLGEGSFCGDNVCLGMVPSESVFDEVMAQSPMVECEEFIHAKERPASWTTQWQQDWFIYHNLFSKEAVERSGEGEAEPEGGGNNGGAGSTSSASPSGSGSGRPMKIINGVVTPTAVQGAAASGSPSPPSAREKFYFAEVGAYHPFKYSNTLFFEKCLHWEGICVEPNPYHSHLFKTYRRCQLVPHCVWSFEKTVTMSFAKDMIEAAVPDEATGDIPDINTYDVHAQQNSKKAGHQFDAVCLPLDAILRNFFDFPRNEFGQRIVDYVSLDAEHAEVEILKVFPFEKWDIKVWLIEVQPDNFYAVDAILLTNGYGKVAVLGGDHVYVKLGNLLTELDYVSNAKAEQEGIMGNKTHGFHEHKQPKIDYSTNRPRSALKKKGGGDDGEEEEEGSDDGGGREEDKAEL